MKILLEQILPRLLPQGVCPIVLEHEGKSDLEKSIPRKLRAWRTPGTRFVVVRDNDGGDCRALKDQLTALCTDSGRPETLVRIVCQELESWYIGDFLAVDRSGLVDNSRFTDLAAKQKYRNPDGINNAKQELRKLAPSYMPLNGARAIAPVMDVEANRSRSFNVFVDGTRRLANGMIGGGE